jgi:hypothetical protein
MESKLTSKHDKTRDRKLVRDSSNVACDCPSARVHASAETLFDRYLHFVVFCVRPVKQMRFTENGGSTGETHCERFTRVVNCTPAVP